MFPTLEFYAGKEIDFDALAKNLVELGYSRNTQVGQPGDFAIRGGVVDVFPSHYALPVRVSLYGDVVEHIHTFDPSSGQNLEPHQMVIITSTKLRRGGQRHELPAVMNPNDYGEPVDPFVDLEPGDYAVHIIHGIARYKGLKHFRGKGVKKEDCLTLEFAGHDVLYVPMKDLHLVSRYRAFGKMRPALSKLGSKSWEKLKNKTQEGVFSFAGDLLNLQAKRQALEGYRFPKDTDWQKRLEDEFPYDETPDQEKACEDVKEDMEAKTPMDRLLCGDVGYGKTEVALRAAFKAVTAGKQVAILVPTTILAEQHWNTFRKRLKNFPVEIQMLSRFQTKSQQDKTVQAVKEGACDIVIGTHRLLSKDIAFKDLGLLVIDEEQRFGVRHKEKLKSLRLLVDVLTLTATPIPRTLYMALVGARSMSNINTPPKGRQAVKTVVTDGGEKIIAEALNRELERGGQAFFIHNRVNGIEMIAAKIKKLAPRARIAVGHGQMRSKDLEKVMQKFINGEIDVLVSTTIVESGIDIPNTNTLIINRADLFGLSELYQLRGRVGRFDREAYAYMLVPKHAVLTSESRKRLEAIEKFAYLGSGFHIAMQDLEIRGAGNILGTEQSGYIATVGFDLYCRMLKETVKRLSEK